MLWPPFVLKKTRSPSLRSSRFICLLNLYCAWAVRGTVILYTFCIIIWVKAEQSIQFLVLPPIQYSVPHHSSIDFNRLTLVSFSTVASNTIAYFNCKKSALSISNAFSDVCIFALYSSLCCLRLLYEGIEGLISCLEVTTCPGLTDISRKRTFLSLDFLRLLAAE